MALSSSNLTAEPRAFSIGPVKIQMKTFSVASADTSGTITFDGLTSVRFILINGIHQSSAATFSGNVATLAFADPAATVVGQVIGIGV